MTEMSLIIDRRGYELSIERQCLRVQRDGKLLERIPLRFMQSLVVRANARLDSLTLQRLAEANVAVTLMSGGRHRSPTVWSGNNRVRIRRQQFRTAEHEQRCLGIAKHILARRLTVMCGVIKSLEEQALSWPFFEPQDLDRWITRIDQAQSLAQLRGVEGSLSREWFQGLTQCVSSEWEFTGRNRRPPRDPVNALLSLSYTLFMAQITQCVQAQGLDTALGFLHEPEPGRPSLVLDLIEPWRPLIDRFVLQLLPQFTPADFTDSSDGVRMAKDARSRFFQHWQAWLESPLPPAFAPPNLVFNEHWPIADDATAWRMAFQMTRSFSSLIGIADTTDHEHWMDWYHQPPGTEMDETEEVDDGPTDE